MLRTSLNKKIMGLALALVATSYASSEIPSFPTQNQPSTSAFFKKSWHPESPNLLQQALVFFTGTQQNHWTIDNMLPFYASNALFWTGLSPYIQRAACGRDGEKVFKNGTKDHFLRWIPILNSIVQFFYMPGATSKLIKDIEAECQQLGIRNEISRGSVPENENYLLLLRPANYRLPGTFKIVAAFFAYLTLRKMGSMIPTINRLLDEPDLQGSAINSYVKSTVISTLNKTNLFDKTDGYVTAGAFALFLISRYCFYFNRYIIPYSTIEKLSPDVQERCYNLMWYHK